MQKRHGPIDPHGSTVRRLAMLQMSTLRWGNDWRENEMGVDRSPRTSPTLRIIYI